MLGQVTVWTMTEEERQEYIKAHPIKPTKKERPVNFDSDYPDWKWRHDKRLENSKKAGFGHGGNDENV